MQTFGDSPWEDCGSFPLLSEKDAFGFEADQDSSMSEGSLSVDTPDMTSDSDPSLSNSCGESSVTTPPLNEGKPVLIWDWDDTILPTSYLAGLGLSLDGPNASEDVQQLLDAYSECALKTLIEAEKFGRVVVVTNAETGWIELTTAKFMPLIANYIQKLPILSARSTFEPKGFTRPYDWKEKAFAMVVESHGITSGEASGAVWSIGDSMHERDAVISVCAHIGLVYKSIKLMERPDLHVLYRQHLLLQRSLQEVAIKSGAMDVRVQLAVPDS